MDTDQEEQEDPVDIAREDQAVPDPADTIPVASEAAICLPQDLTDLTVVAAGTVPTATAAAAWAARCLC